MSTPSPPRSRPGARRPPGSKARATPPTRADALHELREWIEAGKLPELMPTRQARSLQTAMSLVEAGRALLRDHALEDLSVETVCQHAGTTVGAFYGRFENKHAFFVTIQRMQTMRSEAAVARFKAWHEGVESTVDDICNELVELTVQNFRTNLGVLRASLQHTREGMWDLFKVSGDRFRAVLAEKLVPQLTHLPAGQRKLRVLFAYQALAGTLVHAVLNNPGPLMLEDEALVAELVRMLKAYLEAPS